MSYLYDHEGNRVKYVKGANITYYPNKFYNISGTKKTKQIYVGEQLVATIETNGAVVTPYYIHSDHLGSTNVVTDSSGTNVQLLDYYPYGMKRISAGTYNEQRQYIGQIYDADTMFDYLNARYYKPDIGRFLSEDPVFWNLSQELLLDPQQQNSYSYGRDNPIKNSDPTGNLSLEALINDPIGSIRNSAGWGLFSLGGNLFNKPFSASLLRHSASLEPNNLTIDSNNQKQYGNPVNKIMKQVSIKVM